MILAGSSARPQLAQSIKDEARRLGFVLAGVTTPDPPRHFDVLERWLARGHHAGMGYMAERRSLERRKDPRLLMPECKSILVVAAPYSAPTRESGETATTSSGRSAAYAWGADYHLVLPERLKAVVSFIERQVGRGVTASCFTDSAPILERELAERAGLGWIGMNSCLINPRLGSYVLLAEIFLDVDLEPDQVSATDHCGTCTRCIEACPTSCIMPDRTLDSRRCISYLTIEHREGIPAELRAPIGNWVFGCDICQMVCPWNRFAPTEGDPDFGDQDPLAGTELAAELELEAPRFEERYRGSPIMRTRVDGYRRNVAVVMGNVGELQALPVLRAVLDDRHPMVAEHAEWAMRQIEARMADSE